MAENPHNTHRKGEGKAHTCTNAWFRQLTLRGDSSKGRIRTNSPNGRNHAWADDGEEDIWVALPSDTRCGLEHKSRRRAKLVAPLASAQIRRVARDCGVTATWAQEPISVFSGPHNFRTIWAIGRVRASLSPHICAEFRISTILRLLQAGGGKEGPPAEGDSRSRIYLGISLVAQTSSQPYV